MKRVAVLAVAALAVAQTPELPARLTLPVAIDVALRNSATVKRAAGRAQQSQGQAGQAHAALMPQFTVAVSDVLQTVSLRALGIDVPQLPARTSPFSVVEARAHASYNIINQQAREKDRAARWLSEAAALTARNARETVAVLVAGQFARAERAQSAAGTLERQVTLAQELHRIAEERARLGAASQLEERRARQQVTLLKQSLAGARQQAVGERLELANLLNARITGDFEVMMREPAPGVAAEVAVETALNRRLDWRAAQARITAAEHAVAAAKAARYPTLQFRAHYGQIGRKPFENLNTFQVAGALNVPVFTGGRIEGEKLEAEGQLAEAKAALTELRARIETDLAVATGEMKSATEQLELARQTRALAEEELELARVRFTAGAADNTEVVNAQERVARAEENLIRARFDWHAGWTRYHAAAGDAEETFGKEGQ